MRLSGADRCPMNYIDIIDSGIYRRKRETRKRNG